MKQKLLSLTFPGEQNVTPPDGIPNGGNLAGILYWVINALTILGIIAAIMFLLIGGVKWITSGGDKEKLTSARRTIVSSIIGIIVIILSVVIVKVIEGLLGVSTINVSE